MNEHLDQRPARHEITPGWGQSLGRGAAGTALLHVDRARSGAGQWATVQRWATAMTREPVNADPTASLYQGAPAVAYVLHTAGQPAYTAALAALDTHIEAITRQRLEQAAHRIRHRQLPALREFDLISGLTGLGVYLLHRHGTGPLLRDVLSYLAQLTEPLDVNGHDVPGWWTLHGPADRPSPDWPGGHANLGIAHGIAGPLALLSTAMRRGVTVTGQRDAITGICAWLDTWRVGTGPRCWWPAMLSMAEHRTRQIRQPGPGRPSWCYGTPGLARAQQLAALALHDLHRQQQAEQALIGCLTDERQLAHITDASLCHGWAGLTHTTRRVAADAPDGQFTEHLDHLHARTRNHLHRHGPPDDGGLLEGTAGIHLTQAVDRATTTAPHWDNCLLLAG